MHEYSVKQMFVSLDLQISINNKARSEQLIVNLEQSQSLSEFKRHLLSLSKLSPGEHEKYLLSYHYKDFVVENEEDMAPYFMPIMQDVELRKYIMQCVLEDRKISLKFEKHTIVDTVVDSHGPKCSLRRKQQGQKKARNEIEFSSNGQVLRDNFQVLQERPHYSIHSLEAELEFCAFCRGPSIDEDLRVKCGPMYGPIKVKMPGGTHLAYVHELCALWTPEIFLDDRNKFRNLNKGIKRCNVRKCTKCREKGGGLGCFVSTCNRSYHYLCAKEDNCLFVNSKFIIYCDEHRPLAPEEYLEDEKLEEEVTEGLQHYICSICKSGLDEAHIMICEGCDRGFHSNCHEPVVDMESMAEDEAWYCKSCSLEAQL